MEQSGERGLGVILAGASIAAFAALLFLVFAPAGYFRKRAMKAIGAVATLIALLPVAAVSAAALAFVGVPYGTSLPRLDWPLFAVGFFFGLGAASIAALGFIRTAARGAQPPPQPAGADAATSEPENLETLLYTPLVGETAQKPSRPIDRPSTLTSTSASGGRDRWTKHQWCRHWLRRAITRPSAAFP